MKNQIERSYAGLVTQATQAVAGLDLYATAIGVVLVTRNAMHDKLVAYITGNNDSTQEKTSLSKERAALRSSSMTAFNYLVAARDMLKPVLGRRYTPAWNEVGFVGGSLEVPRIEKKMIQYLQSMVAFFTEHPDLENAALNITAARTTLVLNALTGARNTVNNKITTLQLELSTRNADGKELRKMVSMLLKELGMKLHPMDERWPSFGFNKPGAIAIPAVPKNLIAVLISATSAALKWDRAERAERYRIWKKVVGVDEEFVLVETREDLDYVIEGLPANKTIEIAISAVNDGGESAKSEVVTVVTA